MELRLGTLADRHVHGHRRVFLLVVLGGLMASMERAGKGTELVLSSSAGRGRGWRLQVSAHAGAAVDPEERPGARFEFAMLERWAGDFAGSFGVLPGERPHRDPDWALDLP